LEESIGAEKVSRELLVPGRFGEERLAVKSMPVALTLERVLVMAWQRLVVTLFSFLFFSAVVIAKPQGSLNSYLAIIGVWFEVRVAHVVD
jgi:hypothetical protein